MRKEGGTYLISNGTRLRVSPADREKLLNEAVAVSTERATEKKLDVAQRSSTVKKSPRGE